MLVTIGMRNEKNFAMWLSRKSKLNHLSFDVSSPRGSAGGKNSGRRSLLLASNAFKAFEESFAANGCRPALIESTCRSILRGNLVPEELASPGRRD